MSFLKLFIYSGIGGLGTSATILPEVLVIGYTLEEIDSWTLYTRLGLLI